MPFDMTSAPAAFMNLMNKVFKPFLNNFIFVQINDKLIYSKDEVKHEEHLRMVFEKLLEERLYAKFKKYELWLRRVAFLGYVIIGDKMSMNPAKIELEESHKF